MKVDASNKVMQETKTPVTASGTRYPLRSPSSTFAAATNGAWQPPPPLVTASANRYLPR